MDRTKHIDTEQLKLWNGIAGRAWVESQEMLDRILQPFEEILVAAISERPRKHVLDVGCGTGGTTLTIARLLEGSGRCTGIDLSVPMIDATRARAERMLNPPFFICADAQRYELEPATFDMIVSRFGVMFFDDPTRAFANLKSAATNDAEMRFIAWRSAAENPFMTTAERAAAKFLPNLPPRRPDAPGQFAFADARRVRSILQESGWAGIEIRPIEVDCTLPEKELLSYITRLGPVGRILQEEELDERSLTQLIETMRAAFESYVYGVDVRFTAACWLVSARAL
jgi:SAM-dependent methyltransferase